MHWMVAVDLDKERSTAPALLAAVEEAARMVDGKDLRIDVLLIRAEVVAASDPAAR